MLAVAHQTLVMAANMKQILTLLVLLVLAMGARANPNMPTTTSTLKCDGTSVSSTETEADLRYDLPAATDCVRVSPTNISWSPGFAWKAYANVAVGEQYEACLTDLAPGTLWSAHTCASWGFVPKLGRATPIAIAWVNPTQNSDGSPLTDLTFIRIEWGTCNGQDSVTKAWNFGTPQSSISVPPAGQTGFAYPTGIGFVCIRAYAINSKGGSSDPSGVVSKNLFGQLGKPVTLGQPILFP